MSHPDFDVLVGISRSEAVRPEAMEHASTCEECSQTVAWAMAVRSAAAEATALAAPAGAWPAIEARLDAGERMLLPGREAGGWTRAAAVAAGLVLCASVAAALVPQTGVRAWIERQIGIAAPVETSAPVEGAPASTGLALPLRDGVMHVELSTPAAPLVLRLRMSDGSDLEVHATGGAAAAQFLAGTDRLEITGAAGGEITLLLPRSARLITIDAGGVRAVELRDARLSVYAQGADTIGTEVILPVH